jgi:hypothetical protein
MFVALVRSARSVLDVAPPAAVTSACPKLRIEGVQHFGVEGRELDRYDQRLDVGFVPRPVATDSLHIDVDHVEELAIS